MSRLSQILLWTALVLALVGTLKHTAWAFATLEDGDMISGSIQAAALDVGMVALALGIQARKRAQHSAFWLWIGAGCFCGISIYANFLHGYANQSALDAPLADWRPGLLAAVLPLMLFYLVEIVSHAPQPATLSAPAVAPSAADQPQSDPPAQQPASEPPLEIAPVALVCEHCEQTFKSINALNAHQWRCKARSAAQPATVSANGNGAHKPSTPVL
jgi:hypothetical protein